VAPLLSRSSGLASFLIVVFFSVDARVGLHLIARDWSEEVGVNYAPRPSWEPRSRSHGARRTDSSGSKSTRESEIRQPAGSDDTGIADPLADVLAEIKAEFSGASAAETGKAPTLVFGGDRWGRDVLKKTIKGTETSMFVRAGRRRARRVSRHRLWALAGYYGGWIDDLFNWFYSVFTSIPICC